VIPICRIYQWSGRIGCSPPRSRTRCSRLSCRGVGTSASFASNFSYALSPSSTAESSASANGMSDNGVSRHSCPAPAKQLLSGSEKMRCRTQRMFVRADDALIHGIGSCWQDWLALRRSHKGRRL
jgi:hypothetical protein